MTDYEHSDEDSGVQAAQPDTPPTQAQLYDDLRRIGQLEDQKLAIQNEIDERTERLRNAIPSLAQDSLLYRLLSTTMKSPAGPKAATKPRRVSKKTSKKKRR